MQKMQYEKISNNMILLNDFKEIEPTGTYSLFLRHAERYKIPVGEFGNEIELNESGFKQSELLGKIFENITINAIHTSPIKRCIQTGESIIKGTRKSIPICETKILGDPGAFIDDAYQAGQSFLNLGFEKCYYDLLRHAKVEGNRDIDEGAKIITEHILNNIKENSINIYISHDMIVGLYAFAEFEKKYTPEKNWVNYLSGLIIKHY